VVVLAVKNLGFKVYKYKYVFETAKSNWGAGYKAQDAKNKKQETNTGIHLFKCCQFAVLL